MNLPALSELERLFDLLGRRAPDLMAPCRFLLLGHELAPTILQEHSRVPTEADLARLQQLLKEEAKDLDPLGKWMVVARGRSAAAMVEQQLNQLVETEPGAWEHPVQVLHRHRVEPAKLLRACDLRLLTARGKQHEHLETVHEKLKRAASIAERAKQRRSEKVCGELEMEVRATTRR